MKKSLLLLAAGISMSVAANAQLASGSVAPNWTFTDLEGNTHTLYDMLDAGKTVFIDVSAAWCGPCWSYHNTHALRDLYNAHGPTTDPDVSASSTNDVMVFFIEGEPANTTSQLYGPAGGSGATLTQGDWVTGTTYPIISPSTSETNTFNSNYNINYFPTVYMVCRDRLVYEVGTLTADDLYARAQEGCPTTAPSATKDAKAVAYADKSFFVCTANPKVKFQNYSTTTPITAATINVYSGSTLVTSYNWTGSLAPFAVQEVTIPTFTPAAAAEPFRFEVVVDGDTYTANNSSDDGIFKVFAASSPFAMPYNESFNGWEEIPGNIAYSGGSFLVVGADASPDMVQADGTVGDASIFYFYDLEPGQLGEMLIGNYNTASMTTVALDFDVAYRGYTAASPENDKLEVMVSNDCGTTWSSAWSKAGNELKTLAPATGLFIPTAASDWRHETVNLTAYKGSNMLIKFKGTSGYGNNAWVDNINLDNTLAVTDVITDNSVSLFPNPATASVNVNLNVKAATELTISIVDMTGRTVAEVNKGKVQAGAMQVNIATANLASGLYNVKIQTTEGSMTKRLTVVK